MGAGLAVGAAVADGELGSVMGSMLLNVHVPTTHTTSHLCRSGRRRVAGSLGEASVRQLSGRKRETGPPRFFCETP